MEDLYHHFGQRKIWDKHDVPKAPSLDVTEIWQHPSLDHVVIEHKTISSADLDDWIEESPSRYFGGEQHARIVRLVWVGKSPTSRRQIPSTRSLDHVLDSWLLKAASEYAQSCFAGVSALPPKDDVRTFTVTYHPKLAVAWSHTSFSEVGSGLLRSQTHGVIYAEPEERSELVSILESHWRSPLVTQAMFPAFLCAIMFIHQLDETSNGIKTEVREVELRTGHRRNTRRRQEAPASGELGHLSAKMSGCASKLASGVRKIKVAEALNDFISAHTTPPDNTENSDDSSTSLIVASQGQSKPVPVSGKKILESSTDLIKDRIRMQVVENEYMQQRVQIQIAALFHLIAQQDNAIAFDAANATRSIAASSQKDSSSMKMLALVAMFFLPGSFIAALFSTPLFDWNAPVQSSSSSIGIHTLPQFGLFWAITVPLTAFIFILYSLWMYLLKRGELKSDMCAAPERTQSFSSSTFDSNWV